MSRARVAELHRQLAEIHRELAEEIEREQTGPRLPDAPKSKARRAIRDPYVPTRKLSDIEMARARQRAKKLGIPIP